MTDRTTELLGDLLAERAEDPEPYGDIVDKVRLRVRARRRRRVYRTATGLAGVAVLALAVHAATGGHATTSPAGPPHRPHRSPVATTVSPLPLVSPEPGLEPARLVSMLEADRYHWMKLPAAEQKKVDTRPYVCALRLLRYGADRRTAYVWAVCVDKAHGPGAGGANEWNGPLKSRSPAVTPPQ
jgi:hypothetical protein